jgi:transcription elongation factor GreA
VLENARVIDKAVLNNDGIGLLNKVEMTNLANNARMTYTIASPHEANLREGKISIKSPIAQALLNKKVGDIVEVRVPAGIQRLRIESISL